VKHKKLVRKRKESKVETQLRNIHKPRTNKQIKMNLSTTIWGPSMWRVLHSLSFSISDNSREKDRKKFIEFLQSLRTLLPCEDCRLHFAEYLDEHNPQKAENLAVWTFDFHNAVNQRLGKPQFSFEDVSKVYESSNSHCDMKCASASGSRKSRQETMDFGMLALLIVILCVSTSLVFLMKRHTKTK
jgi:hypothetical protein